MKAKLGVWILGFGSICWTCTPQGSINTQYFKTLSPWTQWHSPWAFSPRYHNSVSLALMCSLTHSVSSSEDRPWVPPRIWGSLLTFPKSPFIDGCYKPVVVCWAWLGPCFPCFLKAELCLFLCVAPGASECPRQAALPWALDTVIPLHFRGTQTEN